MIITHRCGRKSWHGLRHRLHPESHTFRVVALVLAGRCQNLLSLHGGQVCRRGSGLKRNAYVTSAIVRLTPNLIHVARMLKLS